MPGISARRAPPRSSSQAGRQIPVHAWTRAAAGRLHNGQSGHAGAASPQLAVVQQGLAHPARSLPCGHKLLAPVPGSHCKCRTAAVPCARPARGGRRGARADIGQKRRALQIQPRADLVAQMAQSHGLWWWGSDFARWGGLGRAGAESGARAVRAAARAARDSEHAASRLGGCGCSLRALLPAVHGRSDTVVIAVL